MKVEWNRKYTTIAVYAFLVILCGLLVWALLDNFGSVMSKLKEITDVLLPFTIAILLAFLLRGR